MTASGPLALLFVEWNDGRMGILAVGDRQRKQGRSRHQTAGEETAGRPFN
jgi:hypothetical protein